MSVPPPCIPSSVHPPYFARAVYQIPSASVTARACLSSNLSRSFASTEMSARNGATSSPRHRGRARNSSANRAPASTGSADAGKYVRSGVGGSASASVEVR